MKVVILCGGQGTRLREETEFRPKPLVEIGDRPIVWHIMKMYSQAGFNDFVLCLGYKGHMIRDYFANYDLHTRDVTLDLGTGGVEFKSSRTEPWRVTLVDTGLDSMTGGRLVRAAHHLGDDDAFMVTYGDGVADVNVAEVLKFHREHGRLATVTAVRPPPRFGEIVEQNGTVLEFAEKPQSSSGWINGGFFVFQREVLKYIDGPHVPLESAPLERLAADRQLMTYRHDGYWRCIDTMRDLEALRSEWTSGAASWRTW